MTAFGLISLCALAILVSPCLGFWDMFDMYDMFQEQRYGCQTEGGHCLDMYPPPPPPGGAAGGAEQPEVEMEGGAPTARPQPAYGHAAANTAYGHGASGAAKVPASHRGPSTTVAPATPAPPRRMVANPMNYIHTHCLSYDVDYMSCGRTGSICCYPRP